MSGESTGAIARFAGVVALGAVFSKLLGFLRETALASRFGATSATDAYFMAMIIPTLMLMGVGPAVTTTLIPVFTDIDRRRGRHSAFASVSIIINACALVAAVAMVLGLVFARPVVSLVAPGFSGPTYELTVQLTVIMFPIAVFSVITHCITGVLHALGKFTVPALTGIVQNVVIIGSILVFGPKFGIVAVGVGTSLGALSMLLVQIPALRAAGYRHSFKLDWHDQGLHQVGRLMGPIVAGTAAAQAGTLVIRTLASRLPEGSITFLNYAQRLVGLPGGVFGTALVTVLYPNMARMYASDKKEFMNTFKRSVGIIFFTLIPMTAGLMLLSTPVVRLAFERRAFLAADTLATAAALFYLSIGIPFTTLSDLTSKAFYATHDTLTPVFVSLAGVGVNVIFSLALVGSLGHVGLAIASALQPIFTFIVNQALLRRAAVRHGNRVSIRESEGYNLLASLCKSAVAAAAMSAVLMVVDPWLGARFAGGSIAHQGIRLAGSVTMGAVVYFAAAALLGSAELSFVFGELRRRVERRA